MLVFRVAEQSYFLSLTEHAAQVYMKLGTRRPWGQDNKSGGPKLDL